MVISVCNSAALLLRLAGTCPISTSLN
jgi:hypothetical protein